MKTGLKGSVQVFSVDYNATDTRDILDIHRYIMEETWYKMFWSIKKMFIELLSVCTTISFSGSLQSNYEEPIKCVSLTNQPSQAIPILVHINSSKTYFYPFTVSVVEVVTLLMILMLELSQIK